VLGEAEEVEERQRKADVFFDGIARVGFDVRMPRMLICLGLVQSSEPWRRWTTIGAVIDGKATRANKQRS